MLVKHFYRALNDFSYPLKTDIQCAAWCLDDDNCRAFKWEEIPKFRCTLLEGNGLCLDKKRIKPLNVHVDQGNIPAACTGTYSHFGI